MPADSNQPGYWDLEAFLDSLILELDKAQDTLALKGLTRRLTYTVRDAALELQIFPRYDDGRIRFATARPGEAGASRLSIQLGSITDNQIRESANEPMREDDVPIDAIEIDPEVKASLRKVGVNSARDLERINRRNVNVTEIVAEKTGKKKAVDYSELAHMINKARRRRSSPRVERVSTASSAGATELLFEGEHLAGALGADYPLATVNGERVRVLEASARTLRLSLPSGLKPGDNEVEVALDPYAVMKLHVNTRTGIMAKRRTSLRKLEKQLLPRAPARTVAVARSFDAGLPIFARFAGGRSPDVSRAAALAHFEASWSAGTAGDGGYEVESFELPLPLASAPATPILRMPVSAPAPSGTATRPLAMDLQEIEDELAAIREQTGPAAAAAVQPVVSTSGISTAAGSDEDASDNAPAAPPAVHPHAVFDAMGHAMRYANTFDLGALQLGRRFDEFDREIARAEAQPRALSAAGAATDHVDEDLRVITALSKLQPPAPASAAPAPAATTAPSAPSAPEPVLEPVVRHEVPLIAEQAGLSGDAACAAMILAWKHKLPAEADAVIGGRGGWEAYRDAWAAKVPAMLHQAGFELHGPELPNTDLLRGLLERSGPVWVGAPDAGVRGRVITGLSIDAARQHALLHMADSRDERTPGAAPRATTYTVPFMQFIRSLPDNATGWIMAYIPVPTGT